ncbi:Flp family type IVb pilin [Modestobacter sp. L9-4]|uniref:Flp family type IVb pilin n=1 Tax=Modestobacter sp. L9-4 TaxID=2851567 RepID=UPI001C773DA9|nr:Flp family type IVb pilin [Modestobacter sp. L9-4]QXG75635.1 Flp family type IVb pilin [Modestobacter sp. L9-4]
MVTLFQSLYTLSVVAGGRVNDRMTSLKDEKGASAVEYAMLVGVLAVVIIGALVLFGEKVTNLFNGIDLNAPAATPKAG